MQHRVDRTLGDRAEQFEPESRQAAPGELADVIVFRADELIHHHADYLDACRAKRNTVEYDRAGGATRQDAKELVQSVMEDLRKTKNQPEK